MHHTHVMEVLRRLFKLQWRSLPQYALRSSPYVRPGDERIVDAIRDVAQAQEQACRRLADLILRRRGQLPNATYPFRYTDTHYLDVRFLLRRLADEQRLVVVEMQRLCAALKDDREAQELAQEILAEAIRHRERFEQLQAPWTARPSQDAPANESSLSTRHAPADRQDVATPDVHAA